MIVGITMPLLSSSVGRRQARSARARCDLVRERLLAAAYGNRSGGAHSVEGVKERKHRLDGRGTAVVPPDEHDVRRPGVLEWDRHDTRLPTGQQGPRYGRGCRDGGADRERGEYLLPVCHAVRGDASRWRAAMIVEAPEPRPLLIGRG